MKKLRLVLLMGLWAGSALAASDVVVLRGGARIDLKQPPMRQGSTVLLTRRDGTLLSVPFSEIDQKATAAARAAAPPAPAVSAATPSPQTPAEAAKATRQGPKARVKLTDADVGHYLDTGPGDEKKDEGASSGGGTGASVDIANYTQKKNGDNLIVRGTLRNLGTAAALSTRLTVTPLDEKEQAIDSVEASVSNGTIEPGREVNFSATIPVGNRAVGTMRFSPRWVTQAPPSEAAPAAGAAPQAAVALPGVGGSASAAAAPAAAPASAASKAPAPVRTPYGQGLTYAAPAPNAAMSPPADGKGGYIPCAAAPEDQPKPPE
jgi:hypothetical protein